jgi:hypothetical protein
VNQARLRRAHQTNYGDIPLRDTLINIGLAVAILGGSYVIMHLFARAMYVRCLACHTLNARRRAVCRACGDVLR